MQRNTAETVLGAVVLAVAGAFAVFFQQTSDLGKQKGYTLEAVFNSVDGLQVGAPVRVSGVKVGQVTGFSLDPEHYSAIVKMDIDAPVHLPKDSSAVVGSAGLLDGKFVTLQPGSEDDMLKSGDRIEYTQSTLSLEQLLGQVVFNLGKDKSAQDKDEKSAPPATETPAAIP